MDESSSLVEGEPEKLATTIKPEPAQSGSDGTQTPSPELGGQAIVRVVQPLTVDQNYLGAKLGEFSDARSPAVLALAIAAYHDAERYRNAVMEKWNESEREKVQLRQAFYEEREKSAVLEERQRGRTRLRRIQQYALLLGGLIGGSGLSVVLTEKTLLGIGGGLFFLGLLILSLGTSLFGKDD